MISPQNGRFPSEAVANFICNTTCQWAVQPAKTTSTSGLIDIFETRLQGKASLQNIHLRCQHKRRFSQTASDEKIKDKNCSSTTKNLDERPD